MTARDAWRSVRFDGADTPTHVHCGADFGSRVQPTFRRHLRRCSDRWPGLPAELSSTGVLQGRLGSRRCGAGTGPGGTVRCSGTLAPVCVLQAVMLIASDGWGFNCVNGAAQARNWLVQVWGPRAFCRGGLSEQPGISRANRSTCAAVCSRVSFYVFCSCKLQALEHHNPSSSARDMPGCSLNPPRQKARGPQT